MKTKIEYLLILVLASFVFVGCTTTIGRSREAKQWEYMQFTNPSTDQLNSLGKDGWKMVAVENGTFYFERPKH
jgi:hypothetical protein